MFVHNFYILLKPCASLLSLRKNAFVSFFCLVFSKTMITLRQLLLNQGIVQAWRYSPTKQLIPLVLFPLQNTTFWSLYSILSIVVLLLYLSRIPLPSSESTNRPSNVEHMHHTETGKLENKFQQALPPLPLIFTYCAHVWSTKKSFTILHIGGTAG